MGDPAIIHCFTQNGQHYTFKLGLNKAKNEVHSVYIARGTFIAIETINKPEAGFSLLSTGIPSDSSGEIIVPRTDQLLKISPKQQGIITRLTTSQYSKIN